MAVPQHELVLGSSTPLVGRDREPAAVLRMLADDEVRMLTLVGPSGVGKTRIALAAIAAAPPDEHTVVIPLSSVSEGAVMADAVVAAILGESGAARTPSAALWQRFADARVTLLLDNLEQIADASAVIDALLADSPCVTVLATSVRPCGARGERVLQLRPLPVPADPAELGSPPDPPGGNGQAPEDRQGEAPALALFLAHAAAADANFRPDDATVRAAAAQVCRLLGGLPLAIELAAARTATVPVPLMASQLALTGGLGLLRRGSVGASARHDSLTNALGWTYGQLPPATAELFASLSVFEAPATLAGAAAVTPTGADPMELLSELVDLHLVELDASDPQEPRSCRPSVPSRLRGWPSWACARPPTGRTTTTSGHGPGRGASCIRRTWPTPWRPSTGCGWPVRSTRRCNWRSAQPSPRRRRGPQPRCRVAWRTCWPGPAATTCCIPEPWSGQRRTGRRSWPTSPRSRPGPRRGWSARSRQHGPPATPSRCWMPWS